MEGCHSLPIKFEAETMRTTLSSEKGLLTWSGVALRQNAEIHSPEELWPDTSKDQPTNKTKLQGLGWTGHLPSWLWKSLMLPNQLRGHFTPSAEWAMEGLKVTTDSLTINVTVLKVVQPTWERERERFHSLLLKVSSLSLWVYWKCRIWGPTQTYWISIFNKIQVILYTLKFKKP